MITQRLSIHQTWGQIGMQSTPGQQDMTTTPAKQTIEQKPADLSIESPAGQLEINSEAAWAALGVGGNLAWSSSIYSQMPNIALQAIGKIVEDGNRMADLASKRNALADIAADVFPRTNPVEYRNGMPAYDNVKVTYTPQAPKIDIKANPAVTQYEPGAANINYQRGSLQIYVQQKPSIEIQVSAYNWYA